MGSLEIKNSVVILVVVYVNDNSYSPMVHGGVVKVVDTKLNGFFKCDANNK